MGDRGLNTTYVHTIVSGRVVTVTMVGPLGTYRGTLLHHGGLYTRHAQGVGTTVMSTITMVQRTYKGHMITKRKVYRVVGTIQVNVGVHIIVEGVQVVTSTTDNSVLGLVHKGGTIRRVIRLLFHHHNGHHVLVSMFNVRSHFYH